MTSANFLKALGPGLLFAGAAIGVSHLVQSTRAGALYGLGLFGVVLLANLTKYPGLSFGSRYSHATGLSLLEGYRRQGQWTLWVFAALTLGTMFTVAAAVTLVTAALFNQLILNSLWPNSSLMLGSVIMVVSAAICLAAGGFSWLDKVIKVLLGLMAALTFTATAMVLPQLDWSTLSLTLPPGAGEGASLMFVVALAGWMPAPMDISVWSSLWALAKRDQTGHRASPKEGRLDFNVGFALCVVLALCFMVLGTVVMHQPGVTPAEGGVGLAKQILALFTHTLGERSALLVGASALAVMFSTTLTVLDAFPRVLVVLIDRLQRPEMPGEAVRDFARERGYWLGFSVLVVGALTLIGLFLSSLTQAVDLATTLSFVTTPILAGFNHRAMHGSEVDESYRPSRAMSVFSLVCVVTLSVFSVFYLWQRFF
jgi:Mn2+/Fe2+ NRAMP family transporter